MAAGVNLWTNFIPTNKTNRSSICPTTGMNVGSIESGSGDRRPHNQQLFSQATVRLGGSELKIKGERGVRLIRDPSSCLPSEHEANSQEEEKPLTKRGSDQQALSS
jgi:hypothetical protein